eukprot:COSAG02_NODE_36883_length_449_cov_0.882857_1_plen_46_part_10
MLLGCILFSGSLEGCLESARKGRPCTGLLDPGFSTTAAGAGAKESR